MDTKTLIIGAGAAGMMCAAHAGPGTLVIDHAKAPGEKIRISGGGRCNFTNMYAGPDNFLSQNPHFCKSALKRYTQWDFISLVDRHGIAWHEKTLGQLFCDGKSTQIVNMLVQELREAGADLWLKTSVKGLRHDGTHFHVLLEREGQKTEVRIRNLVLATGGKSIPAMGATGLSYEIATKFGLKITETRPALVPLTFSDQRFASLSGLSLPVTARANTTGFDEAMLFTHRGLSGPAILQISSFWREGDEISVNLAPAGLFAALRDARQSAGRVNLTTALARHLPSRLVDFLAGDLRLAGNLADQSDARLREICDGLADWRQKPTGSEGYRTAEVTIGGIDTDELNSRDMMAKSLPGLFAIGEAVDVTGWLGGYNFQWAWSSGWAAGSAIRSQA
ncbi:NAD(P)/FAD-dependent oxidoreductase [Marinovum sp. 2_MG-2023]|uniref:NAD(P)/FAD-dependent oxidoreductase n=1 Tax=unclassified Marinovum TaxID=2647166 RepID=UPI0026E25271|nr:MULTISPECIES: NAD(P)/FAD-dependent oxidoreductase [unclassified Marinovum]MDO6731391.1 NAD(P)/FAD-dependent oxidoreductase [Marinovum sp. 2_MG-2023]MDO6780710.1 NAD(P)/FAD-dependent oxidoreductase [Marinovum sp. 1_MG-2023]